MMLKTSWYETTLATEKWSFQHKSNALYEGRMGAVEVVCEKTGDKAFMKPCSPDYDPTGQRPAHERIASHLAYLLHMNAAPVLLGFHPNNSALPVCFSQKLGVRDFDWKHIKFLAPDMQRRKAMKCVEDHLPILALHVWLQNDEAGLDEHIRYVEDKSADPLGIFAIDQARSMLVNEAWRSGRFDTPYYEPHPLFYRFTDLREDDKTNILEGVTRIENLDWKQIKDEVIEPITEPFLIGEEKDLILQGLQVRRDILRSLTEAWFKWTQKHFKICKAVYDPISR